MSQFTTAAVIITRVIGGMTGQRGFPLTHVPRADSGKNTKQNFGRCNKLNDLSSITNHVIVL